ncbi:hypothetical protein K505DRAFT_362687 [Melanomma pulvis-pyrius CBS 109.77]|uniref:Lytic polysaccharide monooxygenase n=1 Tax=Melanomma pulvis-pyrius CBS 109.77 TaxID=1314802 RepID=A0A6A6X864_9PLEO|nr:hypothetical protein K505DRAFT_362687 [Melanomma pulvis-pyrius CBS 109.77]
MFSTAGSILLLAGVSSAALFARNETSTFPDNLSSTTTPTPTYPSGDPPAIFPSRITDIPEDAFDCWNSHLSYTSLTTSIKYADETDKTVSTRYEVTSQTLYGWYTELIPKWDTTLCDGFPRKTDRQTPTGWYPITGTGTVTTETYIETWMPPSPTCTVADYGTLCSQMYASETSIADRISQAGYSTDWPLDDPTVMEAVLAPPCTTKSTYYPTPTPVTCRLDDSQLRYKVLYWPPQIAGNYSCGPANATVSHVTITPAPTNPGRPNTAHYGDLVMTSPTLYYILDSVQVNTLVDGTYTNPGRTGRWGPIGTAVDGITLSQDPRSTVVSSAIGYCKRKGGRHNGHNECTTSNLPFDLEDLFTVPASKYVGQSGTTVMQGDYTPQYTYPQDLTDEVGLWKTCDMVLGGAVRPTYVALPTDKYMEFNEPWTWDGVIPPEQATPTPTSILTPTPSPGSVSGGLGPVETAVAT